MVAAIVITAEDVLLDSIMQPWRCVPVCVLRVAWLHVKCHSQHSAY